MKQSDTRFGYLELLGLFIITSCYFLIMAAFLDNFPIRRGREIIDFVLCALLFSCITTVYFLFFSVIIDLDEKSIVSKTIKNISKYAFSQILFAGNIFSSMASNTFSETVNSLEEWVSGKVEQNKKDLEQFKKKDIESP